MTDLPNYTQALAAVLGSISPLNRFDDIALEAAGERVLATPVLADRDLPPFNRAQMDGYALCAAEFAPNQKWAVVGKIAAGSTANVRVPVRSCIAIATGAPLPDEADTVIQHEMSNRGDERGEGWVQFTIHSIQRGHAVHARGSDARKGDVLIGVGTILAAHHLGIAAAAGCATVRVRARPRAAVITSGDEVMPIATVTENMPMHQIRNSNGPMACELLRRFGADAICTQHVPDEREVTIEALRSAIDQSDLVITIGGVSAGDRDFFPAAFDVCSVVRSVDGASIQPGRPIVVGRAPNGAVVIGLPGNPVSVLACACLFVWPIVLAVLGLDWKLPWREVELAEAVKPNPHRQAFRPAILKSDCRVIVPSWAGSGDLAHTAITHGLLELPAQVEAVAAGTQLRFLTWP